MNIGLLGRKIGMTRVFAEGGASIPVSVVEILPNRVSQLKTMEVDKYLALQITGGVKKSNRVNKPMAGHFAAAKIDAGDMICEFRVNSLDGYNLGQLLAVNDVFVVGQFVDVRSNSKGKGFSGTVKRYNFRTQDATHGNSRSHRVPGSIGQNQSPGRVFKGKKMAGHLGNEQNTIQNLEIIRVDSDRNLLLIKGAIAGCIGAKVVVQPSIKKIKKIS